MDIGEAVKALRAGKRVQRAGWNGKGMWVAMQMPDAQSRMTLPYLYISTPKDSLVPWVTSQMDVLAEDWSVVA